MKLTKVSVLVVAFGIGLASFSGVSVANTVDPDAPFDLPDDFRRGLMGVFFNDQETGQKTSQLTDNIKLTNNQINPTCTSIQDPTCTSDQLGFRAIIPFCKVTADINCIEEVGAIKEDGKRVVGEFKQYFPLKAQNEFVGDPEYKLPSGTSGSVVTIPGVTHKGGEEYFVTFQVSGGLNKPSRNTFVSGFSARIVPIKIGPNMIRTSSTCLPDLCDTGFAYHEPVKAWAEIGGGSPICISTSIRTGECAVKQNFPENIRFYSKVRLNVTANGWLHGRFADPEVTVAVKDGITNISVEALPIRVPVIYKSYLWPDVPEVIKSAYSPTTGFFKLGNTNGSSRIANNQLVTNPADRNFVSTPLPSGKTGIDELKVWLPLVDDKATSMASMWSYRTLTSEETEGSNECFASKTELTGLVTTNATQYSAGPPSFDKNEGTLTYKVAAPHNVPTGEVFKGRYNLSMRSDVARCVYGFSKAPIRAELSVVSADGIPQIATTIVSEKNGWVYLTAANFEFSAPVIKAKLTQEKVVEPTPVATATPTPVVKPAAKKITIICVKGKTVKKVSAVKPVCPSGFKKK